MIIGGRYSLDLGQISFQMKDIGGCHFLNRRRKSNDLIGIRISNQTPSLHPRKGQQMNDDELKRLAEDTVHSWIRSDVVGSGMKMCAPPSNIEQLVKVVLAALQTIQRAEREKAERLREVLGDMLYDVCHNAENCDISLHIRAYEAIAAYETSKE